MIKTIELFTNSGKAANVFLLLKAGSQKDCWLEMFLEVWTPQLLTVEKVTVVPVTTETMQKMIDREKLDRKKISIIAQYQYW